MKNYYLLIAILIFIMSCQSDDDMPDPVIGSVTAQSNESIGAILSGSYSANGAQVSEKGFEVSLDSVLLVRGNKSTIIDRESDDGKLSVQITTGLQKNTEYVYRGFIKVGNRTIYSSIRSFFSRGSILPQISSLSTQSAHIRDVIEIRGKHLRDENFVTKVFYNDIRSNLFLVNDSVIKSQVPLLTGRSKQLELKLMIEWSQLEGLIYIHLLLIK